MPFEKSPAPMPVSGEKKRHGVAPFIVAGLVFLAGLVSFGLFLFQRLSGMEDKMVQIVVPGGREVTLPEPGTYTIFHEYRSVVGNEVFSTAEDIGGLQGRVTNPRTGAEIPLASAASSAHYEIGGREGRSVFQFHIDEPGAYRIEGRYAQEAEGPRTVLTVSKGFLEDIFVTVFAAIAILLGSIVLSVAIAVVTLLRRQSASAAAPPGSP